MYKGTVTLTTHETDRKSSKIGIRFEFFIFDIYVTNKNKFLFKFLI